MHDWVRARDAGELEPHEYMTGEELNIWHRSDEGKAAMCISFTQEEYKALGGTPLPFRPYHACLLSETEGTYIRRAGDQWGVGIEDMGYAIGGIKHCPFCGVELPDVAPGATGKQI